MRLVIYVSFILAVLVAFGQDADRDVQVLEDGVENIHTPQKKHRGGLFAIYKNHVSAQILNDCIYDHSCSQFSKDVFSNLGFLKGLFLTADRLTRCNRASFAETSATHVDGQGKVMDHWQHYVKDH